MTLRKEGTLDGRGFAIRREKKGERYVCLTCLQDTDPTREAFVAHSCEPETRPARKSAAAKPAATPTED